MYFSVGYNKGRGKSSSLASLVPVRSLVLLAASRRPSGASLCWLRLGASPELLFVDCFSAGLPPVSLLLNSAWFLGMAGRQSPRYRH